MTSPSGPQRAEATELSLPADTEMRFGSDAPLDHVMASARAMRRLKPDPVPDELIEKLIRAATWGPSASNAQHYGFVVVTDRAKMAEIGDLWRSVASSYQALNGTLVPEFSDPAHQRMLAALRFQAEHFDDTPVLVAACHQRLAVDRTLADPRRLSALAKEIGWGNVGKFAKAGKASLNVTESSSIFPCVQNLLLAARANGLAANLTIWHLFQEADFRRALGVPNDYGIFALIPIGWPAGRFGPVRRRPAGEVIHRDRWGNGWQPTT